MSSFLTKHFIVGQQAVVVVMSSDSKPIQASYADRDSGQMKRMDTYIQDIANDNAAQQITPRSFQAICEQHNIQTNLPEQSIYRSINLARFSRGVVTSPRALGC